MYGVLTTMNWLHAWSWLDRSVNIVMLLNDTSIKWSSIINCLIRWVYSSDTKFLFDQLYFFFAMKCFPGLKNCEFLVQPRRREKFMILQLLQRWDKYLKHLTSDMCLYCGTLVLSPMLNNIFKHFLQVLIYE